ncbi:HAD family hydrolase [Actinokineospora cianjurensis]|uniref:Phosphoglycolate phosphatase-like HAD superfamily hydrolase n=1 Tax=Actinokineospora cianjurensis TaxID=585224 RepID=A0A421B4X7_9PSEU|nr:HAD family hydrolase [Actinokineospora cianjurensis]RLK59506.1 phosphoglycolate phosphatase-like HAD superfamily hydrolase [Actinokineospora cianjurensis]
MRVDHIVWDWNGTLFDDGDALVRATIEAFSRSGLPEVTVTGYQEHFTRPITAFYDRLAGKALTPQEQTDVDKHFQFSYANLMGQAAVHSQTVTALTAWRDAGRTQSLLSMYPHDQLVDLPQFRAIAHFFDRVDGLRSDEQHHKEPHLRRHLKAVREPNVLVVGDSDDDVHAAKACGIPCLLYHPSNGALVSQTRVAGLQVPVVRELPDAVRWALAPTGGR